MTFTLTVTDRSKEQQSAAELRAAGKLPAVVYGPKQPSTPITLDQREFEVAFAEAGESTIMKLTGLGEDIEVLVYDIDFNPERGGYRHVDFYAIERGKELTTNVPLEFEGESPVEKKGATVNKILHEIEVTCQPSALPSHITVDISVLKNNESVIHVKELSVPAGVKVENDPEDVVANVSAAREEEPEEATGDVDMDAIEVEEKGKEEEAE